MCNMMLDTKAPRPIYDKLNGTIDQATKLYYASTAALHASAFMYLSFFFRYRRVSAVPTLAIASAYYIFFENANNIMYKLIVDRQVIREARRLGYESQVQPIGMTKNRGFNYI